VRRTISSTAGEAIAWWRTWRRRPRGDSPAQSAAEWRPCTVPVRAGKTDLDAVLRKVRQSTVAQGARETWKVRQGGSREPRSREDEGLRPGRWPAGSRLGPGGLLAFGKRRAQRHRTAKADRKPVPQTPAAARGRATAARAANDTDVITALCNDIGVGGVFGPGRSRLRRPAGTSPVALFTSGNSENLLRGLERKRRLDADGGHRRLRRGEDVEWMAWICTSLSHPRRRWQTGFQGKSAEPPCNHALWELTAGALGGRAAEMTGRTLILALPSATSPPVTTASGRGGQEPPPGQELHRGGRVHRLRMPGHCTGRPGEGFDPRYWSTRRKRGDEAGQPCYVIDRKPQHGRRRRPRTDDGAAEDAAGRRGAPGSHEACSNAHACSRTSCWDMALGTLGAGRGPGARGGLRAARPGEKGSGLSPPVAGPRWDRAVAVGHQAGDGRKTGGRTHSG